MISTQRLRSLVDYDLETGVFVWKESKGRRKAGERVGCLYYSTSGNEYWQMMVGGYRSTAHRFAWVWCGGVIPEGKVIDHIDGNGLNNRIDNLRVVTPQENALNRKTSKGNTSGFPGVSFSRAHQLWRGQLAFEGQRFHLGLFETPEKAAAEVEGLRKQLYGNFNRNR